MKKYLFLIVTILLLSCSKEHAIETTLENNWWKVSCIDLDASAGYNSIEGSLDFGKFYFNSDGSYLHDRQDFVLKYCHPSGSNQFVINPDGSGFPYGDIQIGVTDSLWTVDGSNLSITGYGTWKIIDRSDSKIVYESSRTDYRYRYTLVKQ